MASERRLLVVKSAQTVLVGERLDGAGHLEHPIECVEDAVYWWARLNRAIHEPERVGWEWSVRA